MPTNPSTPPSLTEKYIHEVNFEVDYLLTLKSDIDLNAIQAENDKLQSAISPRIQACSDDQLYHLINNPNDNSSYSAILAMPIENVGVETRKMKSQKEQLAKVAQAFEAYNQACGNDQLRYAVNSRIQACSNDQLYHLANLKSD